jgi:hypothetical protein
MKARAAAIKWGILILGFLIGSFLPGCSPKARSLDPHNVLNEDSEEAVRAHFAQVPAETKYTRVDGSNSLWFVVSSYPYRALNRFDVFAFEHPIGGRGDRDYGYYLRGFMVVSHSQSMKVNATSDANGIRIWHDGALLASLASLNLTTNR